MVPTTTLRVLPAEIRNQIYSETLADDSAALELITAFQPDSQLYYEILEIWFQKYCEPEFVLTRQRLAVWSIIPDDVKRRTKKIYLKGSDMRFTNDVKKYFPTGTRITDITMEFAGTFLEGLDVQPFYDVCRLWFKHFLAVKTFTVIWINSQTRSLDRFIYDRQERLLEPWGISGAVRTADAWIKRKAIVAREIKNDIETMTWTWTAEEGEVLGWHSLLLEHQA